MIELDQKLEAYENSDVYPFHMPGHKRQAIGLENPYAYDITEVDGFDNLHHPQEILKEAQARAAALYDSENTFYLVNGSTCGILTAICAATRRGDKILMARNVHKAVYNGVIMQQLSTAYLYPVVTEFGIQGAITAEQVRAGLRENPDAAAVVITSPTYDGVVSDIKEIAKIVHEHKIPLIVDEAHGAHFGMHKEFPETAVRLGADLVIQSMHKTLPSLTQTALLHLNSKYVTVERVMKYLNIFETSSPSYLLMAGMEKCVRMLTENGPALFDAYTAKLKHFYQEAGKLKHIEVMTKQDLKENEFFDLDSSKLVISVKHTNLNGRQLYRFLLEKYHLQMEMTSGEYVLAMTSIMDTEEGFGRLLAALEELDKGCIDEDKADADFVRNLYTRKRKRMELYQAWDLNKKAVEFQEAVGEMSSDSIYLYPPGIPVIVPGEIITEELLSQLRKCMYMGIRVEGAADVQNEMINIVNF